MSSGRHLNSLKRLVELREREVDRLSADVAAKHAVRDRYRANLERLEHLYRSSGASGSPLPARQGAVLSPVLSLNCAGYKQAVMKMAEAHRTDLSLQEADVAVAQRALAAAVRRHESLDLVLERQLQGMRRLRESTEQKRQDELASQTWWRGRE